MNRSYQIMLIGSTLALCWLGMQVVHEIGHVVAAWVSGEEVHRVVLHPLTISRTDTSHERHPLLVVWGGPLVGVLFPVAALAAMGFIRPRWSYLPPVLRRVLPDRQRRLPGRRVVR
jgi:hypothetical protein